MECNKGRLSKYSFVLFHTRRRVSSWISMSATWNTPAAVPWTACLPCTGTRTRCSHSTREGSVSSCRDTASSWTIWPGPWMSDSAARYGKSFLERPLLSKVTCLERPRNFLAQSHTFQQMNLSPNTSCLERPYFPSRRGGLSSVVQVSMAGEQIQTNYKKFFYFNSKKIKAF